ncbi:MAG: outer membrane protein assembly factor BamD [Methylobacteriaceae bacterium]|jgi:outer membrane protein assembly factor BamD|nr:outer membrane protein assembly factor BamD [Methylobacteriaceae bacterium]
MHLDLTPSKAAFESSHAARHVFGLVIAGAVIGLALGLSGCSAIDNLPGISGLFGGEKYETKILPDIPADDIYDQGLARLHKKDYSSAAKSFGDLEKQYPYSQWSRKGLIMTTFSHYEEGKYEDAIASANRYVSLYPSSPETPYAIYLAGMSYYNQIPDVARDQERAEKALGYFNQIVQKFPQSEYATDAKFKMQVARDQLAGKEMGVGRFYMQRRNWTAAINRFREVLAKYQMTRHTEEALYRLTEAYLALGITNEAQTAAAVLGHNYPDSQWYKDAFSRLQTGGLTPEEHSDSWISKTFKKVGLG